MKRHLVMDLFWGNQKESIGEWKEFPKERPQKHGKKWVKLADDSELFAYFYSDRPLRAHWWVCSSKDYIRDEDVKMYKDLKKENDD